MSYNTTGGQASQMMDDLHNKVRGENEYCGTIKTSKTTMDFKVPEDSCVFLLHLKGLFLKFFLLSKVML